MEKELFEKISQKILKAGLPIKIYIFGSFARGEQKENSDLDIMIIEETKEKSYRRPIKYRFALRGVYPSKDIVVRTPDEFDTNKIILNTLEYNVNQEGILLYERKSKNSLSMVK